MKLDDDHLVVRSFKGQVKVFEVKELMEWRVDEVLNYDKCGKVVAEGVGLMECKGNVLFYVDENDDTKVVVKEIDL